jgi:hypothetical protein
LCAILVAVSSNGSKNGEALTPPLTPGDEGYFAREALNLSIDFVLGTPLRKFRQNQTRLSALII